MGGEVNYGRRSGGRKGTCTFGRTKRCECARDDVVNAIRGILHEGSLAYPSIIHNRVLD